MCVVVLASFLSLYIYSNYNWALELGVESIICCLIQNVSKIWSTEPTSRYGKKEVHIHALMYRILHLKLIKLVCKT